MKQKLGIPVKWIFWVLLFYSVFFASCKKEFNYSDELENFSLIAPENKAVNLPVDLNMEWMQLNSVLVELPYNNTTVNITPIYKVFLWEKYSNDSITYEVENGWLIFPIKGLKNSTLYQWKVIAFINNKKIVESDVWEFTTEPTTFFGNIEFTTQEEINTFGEKGFGKIDGDMLISSSGIDPIVDLSPLESLQSIVGNLYIGNNADLTEIVGFNSLSYTGSLYIDDNPQLINIIGFDNLESIGSNLNFSRNSNLKTIEGFNALKTIDYSLEFYSNNSLQIINGLNNLNSIGGYLLIEFNNNLITIPNFNQLKSIDQNLSIYFNKNIKTINGFENLIFIGGSLDLENESLITFSGFENLESIGGSLNISQNPLLSSIPKFNNLTSIQNNLNFVSNSNIIYFEGFNNLKLIKGSLFIQTNSLLELIQGFNSLESIGGSVYISYNHSLISIEGFKILSNIDENLWITDNSTLTGFCGLKNLIVSGGLKGNYYVSNNLENPTKEMILLMDCN